jgi:hypothetical protein
MSVGRWPRTVATRPRQSPREARETTATDGRAAVQTLTSEPGQKQRVVALEAACHRALQSDDLGSQALMAAVAGYQLELEPNPSPLVAGLSKVVQTHADMLLSGLKRNETAEVRHRLLRELCNALHDLRTALESE